MRSNTACLLCIRYVLAETAFQRRVACVIGGLWTVKFVKGRWLTILVAPSLKLLF